MTEYKVCMYFMFVSGKDPDSFYPGEDKLWLEILLDEYRDGNFYNTVDCNGFELPLSLLRLDKRSREEFVKTNEDVIAERVAALLERNNVGEWSFDGPLDLDWLDISNAKGVRFDDKDFEKRLEW